MPSYTAGAGTQRMDTVPEGEYQLAVVDAEEKTSKAGNAMIELKIEALAPVDGEKFDEGTGPIVWDNLVFTQNAAWKIDEFRAACGEDVTEGEEVNIEADDLIGATFKAHLTLGKNNKGKMRNEVSSYLSGDEPF